MIFFGFTNLFFDLNFQSQLLYTIFFCVFKANDGPQWGECNARQTSKPKTGVHQHAKLAGESNPAPQKKNIKKETKIILEYSQQYDQF